MPTVTQMVDLVSSLGPGAGKIIDDLADNGYTDLEFEPRNSEFVATAYKTLATGQRVPAQALGRTRVAAARSLVSTVARK